MPNNENKNNVDTFAITTNTLPEIITRKITDSQCNKNNNITNKNHITTKTCNNKQKQKQQQHQAEVETTNNNNNNNKNKKQKQKKKQLGDHKTVESIQNSNVKFNYGQPFDSVACDIVCVPAPAVHIPSANGHTNNYLLECDCEKVATDSTSTYLVEHFYENLQAFELNLSKRYLLDRYFHSEARTQAIYENLCKGCGYGVFSAKGDFCKFCECILNGVEKQNVTSSENNNIYENICELCGSLYNKNDCDCKEVACLLNDVDEAQEVNSFANNQNNNKSNSKVKKSKSFGKRDKKSIFHGLFGTLKSVQRSSSDSKKVVANKKSISNGNKPLEIIHHIDGFDNVFKTQETFDLQKICELKRTQTSCSDQHIYGRLKSTENLVDLSHNSNTLPNQLLSSIIPNNHQLNQVESSDKSPVYSEIRKGKENKKLTKKPRISKPRLLKTLPNPDNSLQALSIPRTTPNQSLYLNESICQWMTALRYTVCDYSDFSSQNYPKSIPAKLEFNQFNINHVAPSNPVTNYLNINDKFKESFLIKQLIKGQCENQRDSLVDYQEIDEDEVVLREKQQPVDFSADSLNEFEDSNIKQMVLEFKKQLMAKQMYNQKQKQHHDLNESMQKIQKQQQQPQSQSQLQQNDEKQKDEQKLRLELDMELEQQEKFGPEQKYFHLREEQINSPSSFLTTTTAGTDMKNFRSKRQAIYLKSNDSLLNNHNNNSNNGVEENFYLPLTNMPDMDYLREPTNVFTSLTANSTETTTTPTAVTATTVLNNNTMNFVENNNKNSTSSDNYLKNSTNLLQKPNIEGKQVVSRSIVREAIATTVANKRSGIYERDSEFVNDLLKVFNSYLQQQQTNDDFHDIELENDQVENKEIRLENENFNYFNKSNFNECLNDDNNQSSVVNDDNLITFVQINKDKVNENQHENVSSDATNSTLSTSSSYLITTKTTTAAETTITNTIDPFNLNERSFPSVPLTPTTATVTHLSPLALSLSPNKCCDSCSFESSGNLQRNTSLTPTTATTRTTTIRKEEELYLPSSVSFCFNKVITTATPICIDILELIYRQLLSSSLNTIVLFYDKTLKIFFHLINENPKYYEKFYKLSFEKSLRKYQEFYAFVKLNQGERALEIDSFNQNNQNKFKKSASFSQENTKEIDTNENFSNLNKLNRKPPKVPQRDPKTSLTVTILISSTSQLSQDKQESQLAQQKQGGNIRKLLEEEEEVPEIKLLPKMLLPNANLKQTNKPLVPASSASRPLPIPVLASSTSSISPLGKIQNNNNNNMMNISKVNNNTMTNEIIYNEIEEEEEEDIYQPIWKFKTVGEVQERYETDSDYYCEIGNDKTATTPITMNNSSKNLLNTDDSSLYDIEDEGDWETDDEFMFTTQVDAIKYKKYPNPVSRHSTIRSNYSSSSATGSTITEFNGSCSTLASFTSSTPPHNPFRNICVVYSVKEPRLRAFIYDYDRTNVVSFFEKASTKAFLNNKSLEGSPNDSGLGISLKQHSPLPPMRSASSSSVLKQLKKMDNFTGNKPKPTRPAPPPPTSASASASALKLSSAAISLTAPAFSSKSPLCAVVDPIQAWKTMLLNVNYLEDEEDMIVSETGILNAQIIKEENDIKILTNQQPTMQRYKSASSGNLVDLPCEDDKKSIKERMRNKLQRGVLKLNPRSPKGEKKERSRNQRKEIASLCLDEPRYPIFGVSLDQLELNQTTYPNVPRFVVDCVELIEHKDFIEQDGLYRASGNKVSIDELKKKLSLFYDKNLLVTDDIHTLTSLLKQFFRELTAPLIPQEVYDRLGRNLVDPVTIESMRISFDEMPEPNRSTLKFLIQHLVNVAAHSEYNRMPASNLAIVWGPCILSANKIEFDIGRMNTLAKVLIENYEKIFANNNNERLVS